jgi:hypothetical protein
MSCALAAIAAPGWLADRRGLVGPEESLQRTHRYDSSAANLSGRKEFRVNVILDCPWRHAQHLCRLAGIDGQFFGFRKHALTIMQARSAVEAGAWPNLGQAQNSEEVLRDLLNCAL